MVKGMMVDERLGRLEKVMKRLEVEVMVEFWGWDAFWG
jgi:hypothetical protein